MEELCLTCQKVVRTRRKAKFCSVSCRQYYTRRHPEAKKVIVKRAKFVNTKGVFDWRDYTYGVIF